MSNIITIVISTAQLQQTN